MLTQRRLRLAIPLLISLAGCQDHDPLGPSLDAARVSSPTSLTATAVSFDRIDLAWQDNATNETGWEVHRSTTGSTGTFALLTQLGPNSAAYSDTGLQSGTQYCYKVRSVKRSSRRTTFGEFSNIACATTPEPPPPASPPPAAPSGLVTVPVASSIVWVGWTDNSTDEAGFRVERWVDAGASWTIAATLAADSAALYDGGRASEQQVCYRVVAFNSGGDSSPSNTDCTTPPAGPTDLMAVATDSATGGVVLTWTDNSAVEDGYEVLACFESCSTKDVLPANSTSYVVPCGDVVSYFVAARKDGGYSDGSNEVNPSMTPFCPGVGASSARGRP
jgi:titin